MGLSDQTLNFDESIEFTYIVAPFLRYIIIE